MDHVLREGVSPLQSEDIEQTVEVWEASVRATHDFVSEADIQFFRPLVREELANSSVFVARDREGKVAGFIGVADGEVESLFIDPAWRGQGVGRRLIEYAIRELGATRVDVNEQNAQAVGFYRKMGFEVESRSETDGLGKPYPLLHMRLSGK